VCIFNNVYFLCVQDKVNGVLMEDTETKQKPPAAPVVNPISMVGTAGVRVPMVYCTWCSVGFYVTHLDDLTVQSCGHWMYN